MTAPGDEEAALKLLVLAHRLDLVHECKLLGRFSGDDGGLCLADGRGEGRGRVRADELVIDTSEESSRLGLLERTGRRAASFDQKPEIMVSSES